MTSLGLNHVASDTGMTYDKKLGAVYGSYRGHIFSIRQENSNPFFISASVKTTSATPADAFSSYLPQLKAAFPKVDAAAFSGNRLTVTVSTSMGRKNSATVVENILNNLADFLSGNGYIDCCEQCGAEFGIGIYSINGNSALLCDGCYQAVVNGLETNRNEMKQKKGNLMTGLVGALLGALIGGVAWVLIYQLGYIAAISGLIMAICALKGYELLGGKINLGGIILTCVIMLGMAFFAQYVCFAILIYQEFKGSVEITFFDAFRAVPEFLKEGELMAEFVKDLAFGVTLLAVGAVPTILSMFHQKTGHYAVQKLA